MNRVITRPYLRLEVFALVRMSVKWMTIESCDQSRQQRVLACSFAEFMGYTKTRRLRNDTLVSEFDLIHIRSFDLGSWRTIRHPLPPP